MDKSVSGFAVCDDFVRYKRLKFQRNPIITGVARAEPSGTRVGRLIYANPL